MKRRMVTLALALLFSALAVSVVRASSPTATVASVWTTDNAGNAKVIFDVSETVYVHWKADGSVLIRIEFEDGTVYGPWFESNSEGSLTFNPSNLGYYSIYCTGAQTVLIAYGRIFVVPEAPLATLTAMIAALVAFGAFTLRKKQFWPI